MGKYRGKYISILTSLFMYHYFIYLFTSSFTHLDGWMEGMCSYRCVFLTSHFTAFYKWTVWELCVVHVQLCLHSTINSRKQKIKENPVFHDMSPSMKHKSSSKTCLLLPKKSP